MTKYAFKSFVIRMNNTIGEIRLDLGQDLESRLNEFGELGFDIDSLAEEEGYLLIVMKKEIKSYRRKKSLKHRQNLDNKY